MSRTKNRFNLLKLLVPGEGIEPPTFGLQHRCTTAVLTRPGTGSRRLRPACSSAHRRHCHAVVAVLPMFPDWKRPASVAILCP